MEDTIKSLLQSYTNYNISEENTSATKIIQTRPTDDSLFQFTIDNTSIKSGQLERKENCTTTTTTNPPPNTNFKLISEFTLSTLTTNNPYRFIFDKKEQEFEYSITTLFRQPMIILSFETLFICHTLNTKIIVERRNTRIGLAGTLKLKSISELIEELERVRVNGGVVKRFQSITKDLISYSIIELDDGITFFSAFNHSSGIGHIGSSSGGSGSSGSKDGNNWIIRLIKGNFEIYGEDGSKSIQKWNHSISIGSRTFPVISLLPVIYRKYVPGWWYGEKEILVPIPFDVFWFPPEREPASGEDF